MTNKKDKNQETGIIIPPKIQDVITTSGLDLTKAENYAKNYVPFILQVQEQIDIVKTLQKGEISDVEKARRCKLDIGKICSALEKQKKKDKEDLVVETKFIDKLYNTVEDAARESQKQAKEIEDYFDNLERERLAKLKATRLELLANFEVENLDSFNVEVMSEDAFNIFLKGCEQSYLSKKAEELRLQKEADEKQKITDLHNARKESLLKYWNFVPEAFKALNMGMATEMEYKDVLKEAEIAFTKNELEQEKIKADLERIKLENEAKEKVRKERTSLLQPYIIFIRDYNALIEKNEADFQKEFKDIKKGAEDHWEFERKQQIAKQIEDERLQKIELDVKLKQKVDAEEKAKIEKEKANLLKKGDKAILLNYISNFSTPSIDASFKNANSILKLKDINAKFESFKVWAKGEVEKL